MERYICIHGHFYQPPRENAWLESVEVQDSAHPYHDWNERITAECYGPNAWARILDGDGRIMQIINNYLWISFNFGPTLLSWLEQYAPKVYAAILEGDRLSRERFSGHGSAIAQAYNHMIVPLANRRDKYTQVLWGIRDFESRFQRPPEGMWLSETAVDMESLEIMSELGLKFTILSPYQAARFRKIGARNWRDGTGGKIDPSRPYLVKLPSKREFVVFFYDGPISRAVAFEKLLDNGEGFANRLLSGFDDQRDWPQLVHLATDGESYGHHHRGGEMGLAYALHHIESNHLAKLTNYGEYLEKHPPDHQAEIVENTAWSCVHGVGRWERDCGCNSGGHGGWNQSWREPLRSSLNWLRDELAAPFEERGRKLFKDPWAARNDFVGVILDRGDESLRRFFERHAVGILSEEQVIEALRLLEIQRHAMLMFTSCGWFFDEVSGLETVQVLQYAARAIQLAEEAFDAQLEAPFLERLESARSNIAEFVNGRKIYEMWIKPARVDLRRLGVHFAFSSLFDDFGDRALVFSFDIRRERHELSEVGKTRFLTGRATFSSRITREHTTLSYAVLHMGDHSLVGGVREFQGDEAYESLRAEGLALFQRADFGGLMTFLNEQFLASVYSLSTLFRDEQRKVVGRILEERVIEIDTQLRHVFENNAPLIRFLVDYSLPLPRPLLSVAESVLNAGLCATLSAPDPDLERAGVLWSETKSCAGIRLDTANIGFVVGKTLHGSMERFAADSSNDDLLARCEMLAQFVRDTSLPVDLAESQNIYDGLRRTVMNDFRTRAGNGDPASVEWCRRFDSLGDKLRFRTA